MLARSRTLARTSLSARVATPLRSTSTLRPALLTSIATPRSSTSQRAQPISHRSLSTTSPRHSATENTRPTRPCPSCSAPIPLPASPCPSCSALIDVPRGLSLHSLLSLSDPVFADGHFDIKAELSRLPAHGYDLDPRSLRAEMLKRQALLHPDRHGANGGDVELAKGLSARINKAYEVLANPQKRAEYIVSLELCAGGGARSRGVSEERRPSKTSCTLSFIANTG